MVGPINKEIKLRDYQYEAVKAFKNKNWKGIFEMATGERVIIVMGAINAFKSRVSGTLTKYISCIA